MNEPFLCKNDENVPGLLYRPVAVGVTTRRSRDGDLRRMIK